MRYFLMLFGLLFTTVAVGQETTPVSDTLEVQYYIIEGDTIPRSSIDLDEVIVFGKLKFRNKTERRRYLILRRKTRKVWPYAKLAADRFVQLNQRLDSMESKRERKRYTKIIQRYVENEFTEELKKLTRTEGQILVKLLHRQTGVTGFDLIKEYRSGWKAFWLQTTASMFDISLKEEYDPENVEEDFYIEDILQRSFQANILEEQPTALSFSFLELTNKWTVTVPKNKEFVN